MAIPISLRFIPVRMVVITIITIGMYVRHGHGRMLGVHSFGHTVPPGRGHIVPVGLITIPVGHTIPGIPITVPIIGMVMDIAGMTIITTTDIPIIMVIMVTMVTTDMITDPIMPIITREHITQADPTRAGRQTLVPVATTMVAPKDMPAALAVIAVTPDIAAIQVAPLPAAPAVRSAIAPPTIPSKALPSIAVATAVATAVSKRPVAKRLRAATATLLSPPAPRAMIA